MSSVFKLGYFNIHGLSRYKWQYILTMFQCNKVDILFLAETWYVDHAATIQHPLVVASSYPSKIYTNSRQHGGLLLLAHPRVKHLVTSVATREYSIQCCINKVSILGVYLPPSLPNADVHSYLSPLSPPHIIVGDINARFGPPFDSGPSGPRLRKEKIKQTLSCSGLSHIPPASGLARVDHVFADPTLGVSFNILPPPCESDHPLLICDLPLPSPLHPSQDILSSSGRRFNIRRLKIQQTRWSMQEAFLSCSDFLMAAVDSAYRELPGMSINTRQEVINSLELLLAGTILEAADIMLGSYSVADRQMMLSPPRSAPRSADEVIRAFKRSFNSSREDCGVLSRDAEVSALDDSVAYLSNIFAQPNGDLLVSQAPYIGVGDYEIASFFSPSLLSRLINRYPSTKSCGPDSMHIDILKCLLPTTFPAILGKLFGLCALTGLTPSRWNETLIHLIPKKAKSRTVDNMRPISLTIMFRRIFELTLLRFIERSRSTSSLRSMAACQAGFRRGFSTLTHALTSHERCQRWRVNSVFLDFQKAYDTVPIPLLLDKAADRGAPMGLVSLIGSLFLGGSSRVQVNKVISSPFLRSRGLCQGSPLAPFCFNLFIDDLAYKLSEVSGALPFGSPCLFFADDIVLHHNDGHVLQRMLDACTLWAKSNGLEFNVNKCGVLQYQELGLQVNHRAIPVVKSYEYLGFTHRLGGIEWKSDLERRLNKASSSFSFLSVLGSSWSETSKALAIKIFIRPLYEYGAPIFYHVLGTTIRDAKHPLTLFSSRSVRWAAGIKADAVARCILDLPSPYERFAALAFSFQDHLAGMHRSNPLRDLIRIVLRGRVPLSYHPLLRKLVSRVSCNGFLFPSTNFFPPPLSSSPLDLQLSNCRDFYTNSYQIGTLSKYVLPQARRPVDPERPRRSLGPLRELFHYDYVERRVMIAWRSNLFGVRKKCICGKNFLRSHVTACPLLPPFVQDKFKHLLEADLDSYPFLCGSKYCIIDALLNHNHVDAALASLFHIQDLLQ
jgi:hypothetical protein